MHRRLRRFFTTLREQSTVSYAKLATAGGACNINHIIVKATAPDDSLLPEKYVPELLHIFSISPSSFLAFVSTFTRRFGNTKCWRVAVKSLLLVHCLLHSLPDNSHLRAELLWARSNGFLSLYPCYFRDLSSSFSDDYTGFIKAYARYIDEAICAGVPFIDKGDVIYRGEEVHQSPPQNMKEAGTTMFELLPQLQSLIDLVIDCQPTGPAVVSFVVGSAMKRIIRDSFIFYSIFRREIVVVLENLFQMPYRCCIVAFSIYKKAAVQATELGEFFKWCKFREFCGRYEYPFVERIPPIQIRALEALLNGMWPLSEAESCATSPSLSVTEDGGRARTLKLQTTIVVVPTQWEKFEDENPLLLKLEEEIYVMEPLIKLEEVPAQWEKFEDEKLLLLKFEEEVDRMEPLMKLEEVPTQWEKFEDKNQLLLKFEEEVERVEPLIKLEEENEEDIGWETLLEASVNLSRNPFLS